MTQFGTKNGWEKELRDWTPLELAQLFHETYERLAPTYGYETKTETRQFDPTTPNGKLMIATCRVVLDKILK